jgi:hypothetical protein
MVKLLKVSQLFVKLRFVLRWEGLVKRLYRVPQAVGCFRKMLTASCGKSSQMPEATSHQEKPFKDETETKDISRVLAVK